LEREKEVDAWEAGAGVYLPVKKKGGRGGLLNFSPPSSVRSGRPALGGYRCSPFLPFCEIVGERGEKKKTSRRKNPRNNLWKRMVGGGGTVRTGGQFQLPPLSIHGIDGGGKTMGKKQKRTSHSAVPTEGGREKEEGGVTPLFLPRRGKRA